LRAVSQSLHRPAASRHPVDVLRAAGPVQAQEPRAAKLAFRARARRLTAADVAGARTDERSVFRAWLMRGTVHLIPTEDAGWMLPLFAPSIVPGARKRLQDFGLEPPAQERALQLIHREVEREGLLARPELVRRLSEAGFARAKEAQYHFWTLATLDGELCLGPDQGGQACLVRTREWIGEVEARSREDSLAELARRYLRAYAPATERDLARWSGLGLRDVRQGLERIAPQLRELRVGDETLLALGRAPRAAAGTGVRLLGAYDNYNLAYESRDFALEPHHAKRLVPGGGIIRPAVTVDGTVVGTWSSKRAGKRLAVSIDPFEELSSEVAQAIETEVADIGRFEALTATLV
jgi:Winged helix DNA-binding domain